MGMLRECSATDCTVMTIGPWCIDHDPVTAVKAPTRKNRPAAGSDRAAVAVAGAPDIGRLLRAFGVLRVRRG
jgi:hypothetical protein